MTLRQGAVPGDPPDDAVPGHYGDPFREQRTLDSGAGMVDMSHRGVLRISGLDRLSWLHSLTTQHLSALRPGEATESLLLSPHGHIEHALYLVDDGDATWVHVEPGAAGSLVEFLDRMRFMLRVEVEDLSDSYAVVWTPVDRDLGAKVVRRGILGVDHLLPRAAVPGLAGPWAGLLAYEAMRIAARRPRVGFETDHRTIPHELGWLETAVHLQKGCYRGQETVARVHNLGRPPRRLVFLHLDGTEVDLPPHGAPVESDGRQVGFVGSSARHFELGPIALALVKRNTPLDATLRISGVAASQEVVVPA